MYDMHWLYCVYTYIYFIQCEKLMKSIGILSHLVESDISGKGKGLLLVGTCYARLD
jgi:hypothetical protein